jgi:predicted dehydrogenase
MQGPVRALGEVGAAVVGAGFIGTVHVDALRRLGVQVHGVLSSNPERGREKARDLGLPTPYRDLDDLLSDGRVDVVHIASPNHLHHAQVRSALAAGKHVVCEKPLAMTTAESGDLLARARASGLVHAVNFNIRFYPLCQHVRGMVRAGELGEVRLVSGHYLQDWLLLDTDWNWRLDPELGGAVRAVADIGSHWMDLTTYLTGLPITEVMADLATFIKVRRQPTGPVETFGAGRDGAGVDREIRTEDCATILLRHANGARGAMTVSQVSPGRKNQLHFEIDGALGAAAWDSDNPDHLWIGHRDQPNQLLQRDGALMNSLGAAAAGLPGGHVEGFADTFKALYRAVYADVLTGGPAAEPAYPTFADGHDEMLVCEAVARSAAHDRWTAVQRDARVTACS